MPAKRGLVTMMPFVLVLMVLTILHHGTAAPCSAAQNTSHAQAIAANISASCAAALHMPPYSATLHNVMAQVGSYYTLCQPACSDDVANYTSHVPSCDEANATAATLALLQSYCYNVTHPTMDGGTCTGADAALFTAYVNEPLWPNCSSQPQSSVLKLGWDAHALPLYCGTPTCIANVAAVYNKLPDCSVTPSDPSSNTRAGLLRAFNCTPGSSGGRCTVGDLRTLMHLATLPVWANCSQALNVPPSTNLTTFLTQEAPPQWCTTPCPTYLAVALTTMLPACDITTIPTYMRGLSAPIFRTLTAAQAAVASMGVAGAQATSLAKACPVTPTPTTPTPTPTPTPTQSIATRSTITLLGTYTVAIAMLLT